MFMLRRSLIVVVLLVTAFMLSGFVTTSYAKSRVQLPEPEMIKADENTVKELEKFYEGIEDALAKKDLDTLLTYYADDYNYNGVNKAHLRSLWAKMFSKFDKLYSTHIFSKLGSKKNEVAITCTGVLMGWPKGGVDYEIADNWVASNHYLSKKSGSWKIVGGATRWNTGIRVTEPYETIEYRLDVHPFF